AKELTNTKKVTTTGNLEFGGHRAAPLDSNKQSLGLRFAQVDIPEDAVVEDAYIEFTTYTPSAKQVTSHMSIQSELGNAETYSNKDANITGRKYSKLKANFDTDNLKKRGDKVRTADLSDLITENRLNGWKSGDAIGFKLEGDNYLGSVYSFDKANSPRLVITYKHSDTPLTFKNMITENKEINDVFVNELSTEGTVASKESWIELYNKNDKPVLLNKDITLVNKKKKFDLKGIIIPANGYRVIYMDGKNELGNDHSSFELGGSGNLSLIDSSEKDKRTIDSIDYEKHAYNQTVGRKPDGSQNVLVINEPTFEATNDVAKTDSKLHFNKERGIYSEGFDLALSADPSLTIRYTTDGSEPTTTKGTIYKEAIKVNKTMVVKAIAYNDSIKTGVMAHSYILENNYQNEVTKGLVWQFKQNISPEEYAKGMKEFPIVSVTSDRANLTTEDSNGTFEYIDAHTGKGHGNYFSYSANKKFGQVSASQYNAGVATKFSRNALTKKAKYQFFEEYPNDNYPVVKKFAKLELKEGQDGPQNDIYGLGYNRYDEKVTNTLAKQMGKIALSARYVNYFYNGQYFGVKTLREDFGEKMFEEYFGGNDDEYTKIRFQDAAFATGDVEDKTNTVWKTIQQPVKAKDFQEAKKYIDFDDLINTQILFMFVDTEREIDAVVENSVLENNPKAVKMKFNVNDTDGAFHNNNLTGTGQAPLAGGGGTYRFKWNADDISKQGAGK
ncbi:MAG: chitobiase/beta-hexosaminidase C-terminal domain-containing protein, partial [Vagococcus sp.]|uniref:chitobiase/beta-hexosaminidase C-terminal domain-containing protein n=1 Tax=Vagococcus sp. TaxID=1933889 RepID=UPI002FC5CCA1